MNRTSRAAFAAACLLACAAHAHAVDITQEGRLPDKSAVARIDLTLDSDARDLVIWTDSFQGGLHFDPILALWHDGSLVAESDDRPLFNSQSWFDSALVFDTLDAGSYVLTLSRYPNFPLGMQLADGFRGDLGDPAQWGEPDCGSGSDCPMAYWRLHVQDNLEIVAQVPEPAAWAMWAAGLGVAGIAARRRGQGRGQSLST